LPSVLDQALHLDLPGHVDSVGLVRTELRRHLEGLSELLQRDLVLCASELVANAVLHAHGPLSVDVAAGDEAIRIEVHDGNPEGPVRLPPSSSRLHGRGLLIVETLALAWGWFERAGGKTVWAELPRR
jgi:anti-sigma regulatory factor (Ser/Thr protein kinase)